MADAGRRPAPATLISSPPGTLVPLLHPRPGQAPRPEAGKGPDQVPPLVTDLSGAKGVHPSPGPGPVAGAEGERPRVDTPRRSPESHGAWGSHQPRPAPGSLSA